MFIGRYFAASSIGFKCTSVHSRKNRRKATLRIVVSTARMINIPLLKNPVKIYAITLSHSWVLGLYCFKIFAGLPPTIE
jgi:hypothetical protein